MRMPGRWPYVAVLAAVWPLATVALSAPAKIGTGDGLSLTLDGDTGRIVALSSGGKDVPLLKGVPGGLSVQQFLPPDALPNLAPNGSLEEMTGGNPKGWRLTGEHVSWDATRSHTPGGKASGKVGLPKEANKDNPVSSGALESDFIPATPDALYQLSAWGMIGEGGSGGNLFVRQLDAERKILWEGKFHVQPSVGWREEHGQWVKKSRTFRTKPECRFLQVYANIWKGWGEFWFDDVRLVVVTSEEERLAGMAESVEGGLRQQLRLGKDKKVLLTVRYESRPDSVRVRADIRDESPPASGRALRFTFALPVDATGWWWHEDMQTKKRIAGDAVCENLVKLPPLEYSTYPLASVTSEDCGLALAVPMDEPRIQKFRYDPQLGLCTSFDIGLSPLTTKIGPGTASFSFLILRHEPAWGFRAALKRYYEFFPQFFAKKVKQEGLWFYAVPMKPIPNPEDFGLVFYEGYRADELEYARQKGILVFPYIEPWGLRQLFPEAKERENMPPYEERLRQVREWAQTPSDKKWEAGPRQEVAQALLNSLPLLADGKAPFKVDKYSVWAQWWMLNTDPDLPAPNRAVTCKKYLVDPLLPKVAGIYYDSVSVWLANYENFRPEHLACANVPPSFSAERGAPTLPGLFSHVEFTQWLTGDLHAQGKLALLNLFADGYRYFAHLGDIEGSEIGSSGRRRDLANVESPPLCNLRRALAYQKPVCNLLQEG
ncbi:MAG: hypothetical protein FJ278_04055, partial [Planctomycetes bacterium]|nr:hypothetical protein [Planctomycetota bacterium]